MTLNFTPILTTDSELNPVRKIERTALVSVQSLAPLHNICFDLFRTGERDGRVGKKGFRKTQIAHDLS